MTRSQVTVMWLGLFIVALNVVVHIAEIKSVIFSGGTALAPLNLGSGPPLLPNPKTKKPGSNMGNPAPGTGTNV